MALWSRPLRFIIPTFVLSLITITLLLSHRSGISIKDYIHKKPSTKETEKPEYLPEPEWYAPPVADPFKSLSIAPPPPVPEWNVPKKEIYKSYNFDYAPPLLIGFTRGWPLLIQAVVSYITAGWPPEDIYVIENTGTQWANPQGKLSLQNPFYLDHVRLKKLGIKIIQSPVLLNFAQLQNFYLHLAHEHEWPYYFWSHMDVLVSSWEDGRDGLPKPYEEGYKTIYELCLKNFNDTIQSDNRWATLFFAYDHLALVNRAAYDDVGGWDTYIPYYITDCDMHSRLTMRNWTLNPVKAGIVSDVNTYLKDLRALYRDPAAEIGFVDPNPPPPPKEDDKKSKRWIENREEGESQGEDGQETESDILKYWKRLRETTDEMVQYKKDRGRNTWQAAQKGGEGEPFYYPSRGVQESFNILTDAGAKVYREKWGHKDCDLTKLKYEHQWKVKHDWD
ncbi:hypothetical protein K4F52_005428 [Lecanicillium sp. MT-2017a]|nr:hypothetical protein K4F52_005428 [Lecanicillium sp. MT-2017a]